MKYSNNFILFLETLVVMFLIVSFFTCTQQHISPLNACFERIHNNFDHHKIDIAGEIKKSPYDSLPYLFPFFEREYKQLQEETDYHKKIESWFDSNSVPDDRVLRDQILMLAFQKYLNDTKIDLDEIQDEIKREKERVAKEWKLYDQELLNIIEANNSNWNKGDTLDILLQVDNYGKRKSIFYSMYPYSLDYSKADDTVRLRGILIDKLYEGASKKETNIKDPWGLYFKLNILEVSDTNTYEVSKKIEIGKEFDLMLGAYGRLIE